MDTFGATVFFPSLPQVSTEHAPIAQSSEIDAPAQFSDKYCRLCATRFSITSLHSFALGDTADGILTSIHRLNIGVSVDDGLPQVVCSNCLVKLQDLENFIRAAASAQSVLMAMFLPGQMVRDDSSAGHSDTSSGEEIFGCGKIKREKPKSHTGKKAKKKLMEPAPVQTKLPIVSSDPFIKRWSEFFCCKRCGFQTAALQTLREHSWKMHSRCVVFRCVECVTGHVSTMKRFVRHMITKHHKSLEQCCEYCDVAFASEWDVILHKKQSHPEESHPNKCNRCGCSFPTMIELQTHQDNYVIFQAKGVGGRRIKCNMCNKEFINYITLKTHMDSHDPSKNVCTICNKVYKNKYVLNQHYLMHTDRIQFVCQICGKGFKLKTHLKRHMEIHNDACNFACDKCERHFRTSSQLQSHLTSHNDASSYTCHICSKTYKFRSGFNEHLRTHANEKPYLCEMCQKTFVSWSNYRKHMRMVHSRGVSKMSEKMLLQL